VEERGSRIHAQLDPHYTPLVETHDPDQDPQKGGLLLARYGKGFYNYDAFCVVPAVALGRAGRIPHAGEPGKSGKESAVEIG